MFLKKWSVWLVVMILGAGVIGCSPKGIEPEFIYRGFVDGGVTKEDAIPDGTYVFIDEKTWVAFNKKYFPTVYDTATMFRPKLDFSKEALIYTASYPARQRLTPSIWITGYRVENGELGFVLDEDSPGVIVENINSTEHIHVFVTLSVVNRDEIPADLKNVYEGK